MLKKSGFTLAEVLITLVIIGILAALVVPVLLQNIQNQQYIAALKSGYSNLSQAVNAIRADNAGTLVGAIGTDANQTINVFANKMNNLKVCSKTIARGNCWHTGNEYSLDGDNAGYSHASDGPSVKFIDGSSMVIYLYDAGQCNYNDANLGSNICADIYFDVNGPKAPNIMGRDIFYFTLFRDKITPFPYDPDYPNGFGLGCETNGYFGRSWGCASRIMMEGAMNY